MSKLIRFTLLAFITVYCLTQGYKIIDHEIITDPHITRCGVITYKGTSDHVSKHSSSTVYVLSVKYEDTKKLEDEKVSFSTWSNHTVGQSICFDEKIVITKSMNFFNMGIGLLSLVVLFVVGGSFILLIVLNIIVFLVRGYGWGVFNDLGLKNNYDL